MCYIHTNAYPNSLPRVWGGLPTCLSTLQRADSPLGGRTRRKKNEENENVGHVDGVTNADWIHLFTTLTPTLTFKRATASDTWNNQLPGPKLSFPQHQFTSTFCPLSGMYTYPRSGPFDPTLFIRLGETTANRLDSYLQAPLTLLQPLYFRRTHPLKWP